MPYPCCPNCGQEFPRLNPADMAGAFCLNCGEEDGVIEDGNCAGCGHLKSRHDHKSCIDCFLKPDQRRRRPGAEDGVCRAKFAVPVPANSADVDLAAVDVAQALVDDEAIRRTNTREHWKALSTRLTAHINAVRALQAERRQRAAHATECGMLASFLETASTEHGGPHLRESDARAIAAALAKVASWYA